MVADEVSRVVVSIASIAGKLGSPIVPYGTSKPAIIGLMRSTARALSGFGVLVNAVAPGMVWTPLTTSADQLQMGQQLLSVMMSHLARPDELAQVVAFLARNPADRRQRADTNLSSF